MDITIQSNIDAFNAAFREYLSYTRKSPQEALERKLKNVGINLWRGFQAHQFGGVPREKSVAQRELEARTSQKQGTRVRSELLQRYQSARSGLIAERKILRRDRRLELKAERSAFGKKFSGDTASSAALSENAAKRINLWQSTVGQEIEARGSGIGYLGAAFLWFRNRGKGENRRVVPNRHGRAIGSVEVGEGAAVIVGEVAGLTTVDARYGVVAKAINDETDDTLKWIKEQNEKAASQTIGRLL